MASKPFSEDESGNFCEVSEEDRALFRSTVGSVNRLTHDKVLLTKNRPKAIPRQTLLDNAQVLQDMLSDHWEHSDMLTGEELWFARGGLQHKVLRQLRRGQFSVGAELDLHGMTVPEARHALAVFLGSSTRQRSRCVRIIHGKGLGSLKEPILKPKVVGWLQQRQEVLAFCSAPPTDGGTGALYVLLRKS